MKKPWWVRLCGFLVWVAIALLAFMALNVKALPQTLGAAALFFVSPGAAFGLFVLWAGASIFLWGLNRHARTQAAVMRDVFSGTRVRPAAQHSPRRPASVLNLHEIVPERQPARASAAAGGGAIERPHSYCVGCQRHTAVLYCMVHNAMLCLTHMSYHGTSDCRYVPWHRGVQVIEGRDSSGPSQGRESQLGSRADPCRVSPRSFQRPPSIS